MDIFISSVMTVLEKERTAVAEAIKTRNGLSPVFAEIWPAHDDPPIDICKRKVQSCHIYIGIFDKEWGDIPQKDNPENLSITAMEYYWAKEKELPKFIFVSKREDSEREQPLIEFLKSITDTYKGHWYKEYDSIPQLRSLVSAAIDNILIERFHAGDGLVRQVVSLEILKIIDSEKRKRDKIARDLLAEMIENKEKAKLLSKTNLHEFDTDIWNKYRGDLDFLGSGACSSLRHAYIMMKEQNNYLDSIKTARDKNTERRWLEKYTHEGNLSQLNIELENGEKIIINYLGVSGDYLEI